MAIKGIENITKLTQYIVKRSYSKNEDEKILEQNGYSEDCATAYMDGYVDGLSYILSLIDPNIDFEDYINKMVNNKVSDLSMIKPGTILASKKSEVINNLSIVLSCNEISGGINIITTPIIYEDSFVSNYRWERKYDIIIKGLCNIYPEKCAIDLGTMYPLNLTKNNIDKIADMFSVIYNISEDQLKEIVNVFEMYDKEMGDLYDRAIQENY